MKKIILLTCFIFCLLIYAYFIEHTKGFCLEKIYSRHTFNPRWDFGTPTNEQEKLLNQIASDAFTLIGSGKECYAFANEQGTLIIKFFKQKLMCTQSILNYLPLSHYQKSLHQEMITRRIQHRKRLFSSCQIAHEHLRAQTGVLYLHLNKTNSLNRKICLIDPSSGKKHWLQLDDMEFVVQKRAYDTFSTLQSFIENDQIDHAKALIISILDLIHQKKILGIGDSDTNFVHNLGTINGEVCHIDVGHFFLTLSSLPTYEDYTTATRELLFFLYNRRPDLALYLQDEINRRTFCDINEKDKYENNAPQIVFK